MQALRLDPASSLCNTSLKESALRSRYGVTLVAALRQSEIIASPGPDFVMLPGDLLYFFGKTDKLLGLPPLLTGSLADEETEQTTPAPSDTQN